jgi:hypothetical protein
LGEFAWEIKSNDCGQIVGTMLDRGKEYKKVYDAPDTFVSLGWEGKVGRQDAADKYLRHQYTDRWPYSIQRTA